MNETVQMNGYMYNVEYKDKLSNKYYTQRYIYHIKSDNDNYLKAQEDIIDIMNDESWDKGLYDLRNKQHPSMENAFHSYHTFSYDKNLDVYVYTLVIPYDDLF